MAEPKTPPSGEADISRDDLIVIVAKALCRLRHTPRSVEEAVAPDRQLWQRYEEDARVAVYAILGVSTITLPQERDLSKVWDAAIEAAALELEGHQKNTESEGNLYMHAQKSAEKIRKLKRTPLWMR